MTRSLILAAVLFCATSVASAQYGHQHYHGRHMQGLPQLHQFQPYQYQYTPVYNYSWINTPWGGQATFRSNIPQPNFAAPAPFVPAFPMFPQNNGFNSNWSW